jgi:hypothetical protein
MLALLGKLDRVEAQRTRSIAQEELRVVHSPAEIPHVVAKLPPARRRFVREGEVELVLRVPIREPRLPLHRDVEIA